MALQMTQNPFISRPVIKYIDDDNNVIEINISDIYEKLNNTYIYLLCPLNDDNIQYSKYILSGKLNPKDLEQYLKYFVLYKIKFKKEMVIANNIVLINNKYINQSNLFGYDLDNQIFISFIPNISFLNIQSYIDSTKTELFTLKKIISNIKIYKYLIQSEKQKLDYNISFTTTIKNLAGNDYWLHKSVLYSYDTLSKHDKIIDYTSHKFNSRNLLLKYYNVTSSVSNYQPDTQITESQQTDKFKYLDDYNNFIKDINREKDVSLEDIKEIVFNSVGSPFKKLYNSLLINPYYCGLIMKNKEALDFIFKNYFYQASIITSTHHDFKATNYLNYAIIVMYNKEITTEKLTLDHDSVIDIDSAHYLPVDYKNSLFENVYYPCIVSKYQVEPYYPKGILLDSQHNKNGVNHYVKRNINIANLETFKRYMKLFISGSVEKHLIDGFDLKENNMAICGSIMTACLQNFHPLLHQFKETGDELMIRFFNEYYYESDVDIMVQSDNDYDFLIKCNTFFIHIQSKINEFYREYTVKYTINKKILCGISRKKLLQTLDSNNITYTDTPGDLQNILQQQNVIDLFIDDLKEYHTNKIKYMKENIKDIENIVFICEDYFEFKNIVLNYRETQQDDYSMVFNIKYNISSPYLQRDLELFVPQRDFINSVKNFHLPCVRAYYDGDNVYMTTSCLIAHKTFMNIDYKYFYGKNKLIDIINKYVSRGFGTFLNNKEQELYKKLTLKDDFYKNIFSVSNMIINEIQNAIYKPRQFNKKYGEFLLDNTFYNMNIIRSNNPSYTVNKDHKFKKNHDGTIYKLTKKNIDEIFA
jgi:hypothetical protein